MAPRRKKWLNEAVFYQIYPQSFFDSNNDGIGDLRGIIEKLDYIKDLGCNVIWLNPCFVSPFLDGGFDVEDFYNIAPRYGTNEDMKALCKEVHNRDMHIILDLVPSHTSYKHKWFAESSKAQKNEYTDRYIWTNSAWDRPYVFKSISGVFERDGNVVINNFSSQPTLNYGFYYCTENWHQQINSSGPKATRQELINIMDFWLNIGCDGFHIDKPNTLVKNDPDNLGVKSLWNECIMFLDKSYPEAVLISSIGNPSLSYDMGFDMDCLIEKGPSHYLELFRNFEINENGKQKRKRPYFSKNSQVDVFDFLMAYDAFTKGTKTQICIPTGNHDMVRMSDSLTSQEMKLALTFIFTMPGAPFLYYGDEIGMKHNHSLISKEGGYFRTGARTPMQWNNSKNCGFSSADTKDLYLPVDESEDRPTVEKQIVDKNSIYNTVKTLIALRKKEKALGNLAEVKFLTMSGHPLAFLRGQGNERALVIINTSDKKKLYKTNLLGKPIFSIGNFTPLENGYELEPCSAVVINIKGS